MVDRCDAFFDVDGCWRIRDQGFGIASHQLFAMNDETSNEAIGTEEGRELVDRRLFLQSMGKWSGAAIAAAVLGGAWIAFPPEAKAGAWINRRGYGGGGGWVNRWGGGGGGWINGGGGGWVNRRVYGGGGAWVNRW